MFHLFTREYIDDSKLEERSKHEQEAGGHPHIYGLDVGHARERSARPSALRCHRQHRLQFHCMLMMMMMMVGGGGDDDGDDNNKIKKIKIIIMMIKIKKD